MKITIHYSFNPNEHFRFWAMTTDLGTAIHACGNSYPDAEIRLLEKVKASLPAPEVPEPKTIDV
jgi:hypothetical protein